jgi:hypothetical protein
MRRMRKRWNRNFPKWFSLQVVWRNHHYGTISFAVVAWRAAADSFSDLDYRRPALENAKVAIRASPSDSPGRRACGIVCSREFGRARLFAACVQSLSRTLPCSDKTELFATLARAAHAQLFGRLLDNSCSANLPPLSAKPTCSTLAVAGKLHGDDAAGQRLSRVD